jgi:DNA primase
MILTKDEIEAREFRYEKIQEAYDFIKAKLIVDDIQDECIKYLSEYREIDYTKLRETGVFYADDNNELEFITSYEEDFMYYLGYKSKNVDYSNRYLFPILNGNGKLNAWVGYDYESKSKYLVGMLGISDKKKLLYGIHDLAQAFEEDTIIITEGMFERIRLKSIGLNVGASLLGKKMSDWQKRYINRFKNKILIPDGDTAGQEMVEQWREGLTGNVAVIQVTVIEKSFKYPEETKIKYAKDLDDRLRNDETEIENFKKLYKDIKTRFKEETYIHTKF